MSTLIFLLCLIPNVISQIIPSHLNAAINQLHQQQYYTSISIDNYVEYNVTPDQMLERISLSFSNNTTNVCEQDFEIILQGVLKRDMWAMKIFDAWGKPLPSGILSGHVHWMGNYDECLQQMYLPTNKLFVSQPINT
ncbi:unnamed protein product [Adineta steineri]|uniref:Nose resistant-to-fluoxetine protein N-terminal domain-containing protein n=1 Tax=Adineta steineri TaxID=433720 RepID=A0A819BER6_9BILA|nr:unnamed protein product [Adineta steineri]CAF3791083.1 unnamed protein product [Adineta steineri]